MRLSQLLSVFKRTNVFYPLVAVAIVVPNVALGAYGYWAIRHAQQQADEQVQGAYLSIVRYVREEVATRLDELPARVPAVPVEQYSVTGTAEGERVLSQEAAAQWAYEQAEETAFLRGYFLVRQRELLTPPPVAAALERQGERNSAAAGDSEQGGNEERAEQENSEEARLLAEWRYFTERVWPGLRAHLLSAERGIRHISHRDEQTGEGRYDLISVLEPVALGDTDEPIIGVLWYDEETLETSHIAPLFEEITLPAGDLVLLRDQDRQPQDGAVLVSERGHLPHWWFAVKMPEEIGAFRHGSQVGATVNLALLAIFMPFVAVGAILMIRALVKDIREARQKTDFVSRVTHELKTPLTSIRLFIETLHMGGAQSEQEVKRCLDIIQQESERLSRLIERVLDFSKMEMGNKVYHFREDNIETVVRDTIDFFRKQAVQKGAVIRLYIERNLPSFEFDRDALREVLLNLLENAIKYSVGEKLAAIRLTRTRWRNQEAVQIQVIDNGVGIRREDLPRIFDQFWRVDDTLTKGIDGSGLGLTLSREIARAHAGDILVESQQGRGSKFTLVLPLRNKKK